jgi:hypothetical protein
MSTPRRYDVDELRELETILKGRQITEFETLLAARSITESYLVEDDELFKPYGEFLTKTTIGRQNFSFVRDIGTVILERAKAFETPNSLHINKRHLYFAISFLSIYVNDTVSATIYWELYQNEESQTMGAAFSPTVAVLNTIQKFTSLSNPINLSITNNSLYAGLKSKYPFIEDFPAVLGRLHEPEVFAYFSSGVRFRQIDNWLRTDLTHLIRMYSQELLNSLCILCEACLKNIPGVKAKMLGEVINNYLPAITPAVSAIIGRSNSQPPTGLFVTYPSKSEADFNQSFPLLITAVKANKLSDNELKAHLIYAAYMLRNKSLHDFNPGLVYYNNGPVFIDSIGLIFAAVSAIQAL